MSAGCHSDMNMTRICLNMQMASARGSLGPLGGSSFTFNSPMGDAEMADAPHLEPHAHDQR